MNKPDIDKELKEAGIKYAVNYPHKSEGFKRVDLRQAHIDGAKSREAIVNSLTKEINSLITLNEQLTDKVKKSLEIASNNSATYKDKYNIQEQINAEKQVLILQSDVERFSRQLENEKLTSEKLLIELEKSKGIIKELLHDIPARMWYTDGIIQKAEEFIKE